MAVTNIPPLNAIEGVPFSQTWQWVLSTGAPIDLTLWEGEAAFTRDRVEILRVPLSLNSDGEVHLTITASEVGLLVGPRVNFQINLAVSGQEPSEVWRGNFIVE
jgi:hypothetical protein